MIITGEEYRESIRDGREVYIYGKVVQKSGSKITGEGGFLGTTAVAVKKKGA